MRRTNFIVRRDTIINWSLLFALGIIWGFSFFFIRKGLEVYDAFQVGALRIVFAFLSSIPVIAILGFKIKKESMPLVILSALLGSAFTPFLFSIAQTKISSSVTGILNSLTPLFALIMGAVLYNIKMKWIHIVGVLIGLVGTIIVLVIRADGSFEFNFAYSLLIILATIMYGTNANVIKSKLSEVNPIQLALATYLLIGPFALAYLLTTDFIEVTRTNELAPKSLAYLTVLGTVGTSFALVLFNYLAVRTSALFATMVTYIIPIVAVIIGFYTGESIGIVHIIGLSLILFGVYVSSIKKKANKVKTSSKPNPILK